MREEARTESPYEAAIGFCRAVRIDNTVAVSGTAPLNEDGTTTTPGDLYNQTKRCLEIMLKAAERVGAGRQDIIRTRIFLKDIEIWEDAARAHGEFFQEHRPASTFVEVSRFIREDWLVECEADFCLSS